MPSLIKKLTSIAKKHLGLCDRAESVALVNKGFDNAKALSDELVGEARMEVSASRKEVEILQYQMGKMREKYPAIWVQGHVAHGCVQLPNLKRAYEFFREENRFCVYVPWKDAAGKRPEEFVPPWLEVDEDLNIECVMDKMEGAGITYKIPVRGWTDTLDLVQDGHHASYGLDGRAMEKIRSFRSSAGILGTFRRELTGKELWLHLWFHEFELPRPKMITVDTIKNYLPKGNLFFDVSRWPECSFETQSREPNRIYYFKVPVTENLAPALGWKKQKQLGDGNDTK